MSTNARCVLSSNGSWQTPMPTMVVPSYAASSVRSRSGLSSARATRECSQAGYTSHARSAAAA